MNCAQVDKLKDAYVSGTLDPLLCLECAIHVGECVLCRQRLALARTARMSRDTNTCAVPGTAQAVSRPSIRAGY